MNHMLAQDFQATLLPCSSVYSCTCHPQAQHEMYVHACTVYGMQIHAHGPLKISNRVLAGPRFILAYAIVAGIAVYQPLAALLTHLAPHIGLIHVIVLAGLVLPLLPALFIPWGTGGLRARPIISVPLPASAARSPLLRPYAESGTPSAHQGAVYLKAASPQKADALQEIDQLTHEKVIDASLPGDASLRQADEGAHGGEGRAVESQPAVTSLRCHLVRSDDIVTAAQEDRWAAAGSSLLFAQTKLGAAVRRQHGSALHSGLSITATGMGSARLDSSLQSAAGILSICLCSHKAYVDSNL